jgi:hypothetical protein
MLRMLWKGGQKNFDPIISKIKNKPEEVLRCLRGDVYSKGLDEKSTVP